MKPISRICTCDICGKEELTDQAVLPNDWVMLWDNSEILCIECIKRWTDKWELPAIWLTGGEEVKL